MSKIIDILYTEYSSEYSSEYYLNNYTKPKIYPKVVTSKPLNAFSESEKKELLQKHKRWYVYYSYIDPESNPPKKVRQAPIFKNINRNFKNFDDKVKHIKILRDSVESILKNGFSPYAQKKISRNYSSASALTYALSIKKTEVKPTTFSDYHNRTSNFIDFIENQSPEYQQISKIDKKIVSKFLDTFKNPKNRNNTRAALSSIFSVLSDKDLIKDNFIKEIKNKKVSAKPVKTYSEGQVLEITEILKEQDQTLLMFIYFVSYMFWRPIEIVRIKIEDIDLDKKIISTETKTKDLKKKIIPDILLKDLKEFIKNKSGYLFKPDNFTDWTTSDINKRNYFTRRFLKFREKNKIAVEFKLYSFRHTYITKIYLELRKSNNTEQSIKILSLITGHESKAIYNYIMVNDIELPEDYSHYLK